MKLDYSRWRYTVMLVVVGILLATQPLLAADGSLRFVYDALFVAVFLAAFMSLSAGRRHSVVVLVLFVPSAVGVIARAIWPEVTGGLVTGLVVHALPAIFLGYTIWIILRSIFATGRVTADGINGAICGYLLLGVLFVNLYSLTVAVSPGSFDLAGPEGLPEGLDARQHAWWMHCELTYYSFNALSTLGESTLVATGAASRTLSWIEAVIGQFYIAVILAQLLGLKGSQAGTDARDRR